MNRMILPLAALLMLSGCDLSVEPPEQTIWNATLSPAPSSPGLHGSAAAISRTNGTEAGIELDGMDEASVLTWRIREGDCDAPGPNVGPEAAYPELKASASGHASADTFLNQRLDRGESYHVVAMTDGDDVACGELVSR